jgi:hypothetical protein
MIEKKYRISLEGFTGLIEELGAVFVDEVPDVRRYTLNGNEVYFGGDDSMVSVSASNGLHRTLEGAIRRRLQ